MSHAQVKLYISEHCQYSEIMFSSLQRRFQTLPAMTDGPNGHEGEGSQLLCYQRTNWGPAVQVIPKPSVADCEKYNQ